jgi:hypothetical protein
LIWGGTQYLGGGEVALKTGAAYDPVEDAWEALPTPVDNVEREAHTAIWSGSEMIIWGGRRRRALGPRQRRAFRVTRHFQDLCIYTSDAGHRRHRGRDA